MNQATYGPRSRHNATLLLNAAASLGYPSSVVKTSRGGYSVPQDVLDAALGVDGIQEGVEYPPPAAETPEVVQRPNNGASRAEWVRYAEHLGIEVTEADTRNNLVAKADALQEGTD